MIFARLPSCRNHSQGYFDQDENVGVIHPIPISQNVVDLFAWESIHLIISLRLFTCDVVVSMFYFHRSDRGSNPGRGA